MDTFLRTLAVVSAVSLGIIVVSFFLTFLRYLSDLVRKKDRPVRSEKGFVSKNSLVTVHLNGNDQIERVTFVGYMSAKTSPGAPILHDKMTVFRTAGRKDFRSSLFHQIYRETTLLISPAPHESRSL